MKTMRTLAVAVGAMMMVIACGTTDGALQTDDLQVEEIQTAPNLYLDKAVTVEGNVKEILNTRSFVIGSGNLGMLVLLSDDADIRVPVTEGRLVEIGGEAQYMAQLDVDPDWALDNTMYDRYRDQPIFVATLVQNAD